MKYCGYENLSKEQTERLFNLLHREFTQEELIYSSQQELNDFATAFKGEWY